MDEVKNFISTTTGKVITGILIALIAFLGTLAWKGAFSDTNVKLEKISTQVQVNTENINKNTEAVKSLTTNINNNLERLNINMTDVKADVSNIKGYMDGVRDAKK